MSITRQFVLIAALCAAFFAQSFSASVERQIATGAAADSAANRNTETLSRLGSYAALAVSVLTALSAKLPGLANLVNRIGGTETIERVVHNSTKLIETKGRDAAALLDVAKLVMEKGTPHAWHLLSQLNLELGQTAGPVSPHDPPSLPDCIDQLLRRCRMDAAARIHTDTTPPILPFPPKAA